MISKNKQRKLIRFLRRIERKILRIANVDVRVIR